MAKQRSPYQEFIRKAIDLGATDAKIIEARSIVTAAWVRMKCQFGCDGFNSSFCCPPHTPRPEETQRVIDCYSQAILVHHRKLGAMTKLIVRLEREIFLSGYYQSLGFGCGPCTVCRTCEGASCKYPEKTRPSMEACGIDVFATARGNGFPIDVVRDKDDETNFYGVVLIT